MAAINRNELARRVLERLTVIGSGMTANAANSKVVRNEYEALFAEWYQRGLAFWPVNIIPLEAVHGLVGVLAARCRPHFKGTPAMEAMAEARALEAEFLRANTVQHVPMPTEAEYF